MKAMGRHGVIKWIFEKEMVDFGPKDLGLICRLAGVQGVILKRLVDESKLGESPHRCKTLASGHMGYPGPDG